MRFAAVALLLIASTLASCVQMPTEKHQAVDLRPQLAFLVDNPGMDPMALDVIIDGAPVGLVATYLAGQQAVRVLPGTHVIRIVRGSTVILEEQMYLGDGITKTIRVN
jgi:hypothetical protein